MRIRKICFCCKELKQQEQANNRIQRKSNRRLDPLWNKTRSHHPRRRADNECLRSRFSRWSEELFLKKKKKTKTKGKKVTFWLLTYHSSKNFREVKCCSRPISVFARPKHIFMEFLTLQANNIKTILFLFPLDVSGSNWRFTKDVFVHEKNVVASSARSFRCYGWPSRVSVMEICSMEIPCLVAKFANNKNTQDLRTRIGYILI